VLANFRATDTGTKKRGHMFEERTAADYGETRNLKGKVMCRLCRLYREAMKFGVKINGCAYCKRMKIIIQNNPKIEREIDYGKSVL